MARKSKKVIEKEKKEAERKAYINRVLTTYIVVILIAALMIIALFRTGVVGNGLFNTFRMLFGQWFYVVIAFLMIMSIVIARRRQLDLNRNFKIIGTILAVICFVMIEGLVTVDHEIHGLDLFLQYIKLIPNLYKGLENANGGILGALFLALTTSLFDYKGTYIIVAVLLIIAIPLMIPFDEFKKILESIKNFVSVPDDGEEEKPEKPEKPTKKLPEEPVKVEKPTKPEKTYSFEKEEEEIVVRKPKMITADDPVATTEKKRKLFIEADHVNPKNVDEFDPNATFDDTEYAVYDGFNESDVELDVEDNEVIDTITEIKRPVELKPQDGPEENEVVAQTPIKNTTTEENTEVKTYVLPDIEKVLNKPKPNSKSAKNQNSAKAKGELLIKVLDDFDIPAELIDIHIGPSVTKFEVKPVSGIKVSKFHSVQDNLMMELEAKDIRIEAPIPGKQAVGIEIPNEESTMVTLRELMVNDPDPEHNNKLLFALGKDLMGKPQFCRLDKMPHLLIAGQTGSGKSVCMNTIITSIMLRTKPEEVKLLMIDPKKVEFTPYQDIPHLIGPIVNDPEKANLALKNIVQIMDERYNIFSMAGARKIETYNEMVLKDPTDAKLKPMPYIVVIIDELADLMTVAGKEVETSIQRITQLARAAGIYLIVATQRPSVNVITGVIKANIPSRIAFNVSSAIDSRTILDQIGAERLLGHGDMLYFPTGEPSPKRIQGVFVTDDEIANIVNECKSQAKPFYDDHFIRLEGTGNEQNAIMTISEDPLYEEIKEYVIDVQKASASLLQRRFGIGFNRAARMIDQLEENGIIGPGQGSKPREVYIKKENNYEDEE